MWSGQGMERLVFCLVYGWRVHWGDFILSTLVTPRASPILLRTLAPPPDFQGKFFIKPYSGKLLTHQAISIPRPQVPFTKVGSWDMHYLFHLVR